MKKLLSATLAIAMGATCIWSLAACSTGDESNPEKDAETAKSAINSIKGLYDKADLYETTGSFTLLGKTSDGKNQYDVTWTVSTESAAVNDITEYIKIGTELDDELKYTVTVERPTEDVEYKLTASVTVGSVTETYSITRLLKGISKVYTVAEFLAIDQDASHYIDVKSGTVTNKVYSEDGTNPAIIVVKGYVVKIDSSGGWSSQYNNFSKVYIADAADETTTTKQLYVYRIVTDDVYLKGENDLKVGDLVTLQGTAQIYNSKIQMSYAGSINVTCIGREREEKDNTELAQAAANAVVLNASLTSNLTVTLPSKQGDATLTWEVKSGGASVDGYQLTCPENTSDTPVDVVLTVTADIEGSKASKDITVKVAKVAAFEVGSYKMSVQQATLNKKLYFTGVINASNFGETSTDVGNAVDVEVVAANGGYQLKVGEKYLELNTSHRMALVDTATSVWGYNDTYSTFTWFVANENETYYLGTYGTYETISASKMSYITTDGNTHVVFGKETDDRTPAQKGQAALDALTIPASVTRDLELTSSIAGVTLSIKASTNEAAIALDGTVTRGASDASVTLTIAASVDSQEVATKDFTVTVTAGENIDPANTTDIELSFANDTSRTSFTTEEHKFASNGVTFTNSKSASTNAVVNNVNPIRCYANSSIKVECNDMLQIVFNCNNASYATALATSIGTLTGATVTTNDKAVTVSFDAKCNEFNIAKLSAQVRINSIVVTAVKAA